MARVRLSALFSSISGKYGGGVFRNWKGVTTLSMVPESVDNPASTKQNNARAYLSVASKGWAGLATAVRDAWFSVAEALSEQWSGSEDSIGERTVIYPPRGPYTGLGALVATCGLLASVGDWDTETALPTPPVGVGAPSVPTGLALSGDTAGLIATWTDPGSWGNNGTAGNVRVFVRSEDGTFHTQLGGYAAAESETKTITALSSAAGGIIPLKKLRYLVQIDAVNAEGMRSAPSEVVEITLADPA